MTAKDKSFGSIDHEGNDHPEANAKLEVNDDPADAKLEVKNTYTVNANPTGLAASADVANPAGNEASADAAVPTDVANTAGGAKRAKRHRGLKIAIGAAGSVLAICVIGFLVYAGIYYHADETAVLAASDAGAYSNDDVAVEIIDGYECFVPPAPFAGLVFYPGGKVEASAYAPLMQRLAEDGVLCIICKMPFNLAIFNVDAAEGAMKAFPEVDKWYIGGHSLGGSMAAMYLDAHPAGFEGLVLLGSYSTADLSDDDVRVLSIFGSNDGVMSRDNYDANKAKLPDLREVELQGGNHAQFGSYGKQDGDGEATIRPERQWDETAAAIVDWMRS